MKEKNLGERDFLFSILVVILLKPIKVTDSLPNISNPYITAQNIINNLKYLSNTGLDNMVPKLDKSVQFDEAAEIDYIVEKYHDIFAPDSCGYLSSNIPSAAFIGEY